jgi:hypothetical protein
MFAAAPLLADADLLDARFWLATGLLVVSLLVAAFVVWLAKKYSEGGEEGPSENDQLSHFRTLYEKGEISEEEFNQLRGTLSGGQREQLGLKKPKPAPTIPPPSEEGPREPSL